VGAILTLAVKPQWVRYKLDETIEQSWKCVRVLIGIMSIRLCEDNHDSWVTSTTSAECKTVIKVVLMVMSGMDPHMISWNLRLGWFGLVGL
jgi:hypothetical protein